MENSTGLH